MQKALDRMEKVKRPAIDRKESEFELRPTNRSGKQVAVLEGVVKRYGDADILRDASAQLDYGDKVMLIGRNGAGKSTLLRLILGEEEVDGGELRLGSRVEVGYLAQQQAPDDSKQSLLDYFRREAGMEEGEARSCLAAYLFYGADVFKPVGLLSGGEWTRLRLALLVLRKPNLLVLDEPTNHMDIASREALEEALEEYPGTILAVTHDRYLINRLARKIWELDEGKLTIYLGGFDDYRAESRRRRADVKASGSSPSRDRRPKASGESPNPKDRRPRVSGDLPKPDNRQPNSSGDQPKPEIRQPTLAGDQPKPDNRQPNSSGDHPKPNNLQPRSAGDHPNSGDPSAERKFALSRERLEEEIAEMERRLAEYDGLMNGEIPGGLETERAWKEREETKEYLDRLYEQWLESFGE